MFLISDRQPARDPDSPLERALQRFGAVIQARLLAKGSGGSGRSHLIREPAMPKSKHRRKAGGKTVPHPGRKRGGAALVIIEEAKREAGGLPPQKDVTGLPLFAAATPRIRAGKRPAPSSDSAPGKPFTTEGRGPVIATTGLRPHLFFTAIWQSHHWRRRRDSISASSDGPNHNLLVIIFGRPHSLVAASRSKVGRHYRLSAIRHNHLVRRPIERRPRSWRGLKVALISANPYRAPQHLLVQPQEGQFTKLRPTLVEWR